MALNRVDYTEIASHITPDNQIGVSQFSIVYSGMLNDTPVAIKVLNETLSAAAQHKFLQDTSVLTNLNHPNVVRLFAICDNPNAMIMARCEQSLHDWLFQDSLPLHALDLTFTGEQALQIAQGLAYLHRQNIPHGDLNPPSILLTASLEPKLAGFGLYETKKENLADASIVFIAAVLYCDPETLSSGVDDTKARDVYALAITMWQMLTHELPYRDLLDSEDDVVGVIVSGEKPRIPGNVSETAYAALMRRCWADRARRPTADAAVDDLREYQAGVDKRRLRS